MKKQLVLTPLEDKRTGRLMFLLCFTFYFLLYCGRLNYSAALAEITTTGFLEKDAAGLISTAFFVTYGCGQFVNGFISDRMPPFGMVTLGILGAGLMNAAMYFALSVELGLAAYIIIWALNGYIQSMVWPTMIRIVSNILPERMRVTAGVSMLATTAVGTVLSYLLSTLIMSAAGWRECFLVPGLILISAALIWFAVTRPISRRTLSTVEVSEPIGSREKPSSGGEPILPLLLSSGALLMLLPIGFFAIIKDGITTWTPTIITETFFTSPELSTLLTTVIPLISIFGAAVSKLVMDKWLHDELASSAFMFLLSAAGLLAIIALGSTNLILTLLLLALVITFMLGINTMFISLVPLRFGKYGRSATMTGILNSTAAVCCGISTYLVGLLAKGSGWGIVFKVFLVLSLLGGGVSFALIRRWRRFKAK